MTEMAQPSPAATTRPHTYFCDRRSRTVTIQIDDARDDKITPFGQETLRDRYLLPGESIQQLLARVACSNSDEIVHGLDNGHAQRIYDAISNLWFMPATPVLSNSGTKRGMPISCFLNTVQDNMDSIAETVNENIWLACRGGGIGTSWSPVRAVGETIGTDEATGEPLGETSGIIPFLHWMGAQTLAISQGSLRRGSAAAYLDDRHPEIEEFIELRDKKGDHMRRAPNLHHGLMVSDAFMEARKNGEDWALLSPKDGSVRETVDAKTLWRKLLIKRLEEGEPYIVFSDAVERGRPETYKKLGLMVSTSNLCSEIVETTGPDHLGNERTAVCCLSSLNMEKGHEWFGDEDFLRDVFRFVDNVMENFIDIADGVKGFERAVYSARRERSVGVGMMGFASMLQMLGIPFESEQAAGINVRTWKWLRETADVISIELGRERGPCLDALECGMEDRFTHKFAIAPTASISVICGEVSACGEPDVGNVFNQKTLTGTTTRINRHLRALLEKRYDELADNGTSVLFALLRETGITSGAQNMGKEDWIQGIIQTIVAHGGSVQTLPFLTSMEKACYKTAFEMDQRWLLRHSKDRTAYVCQAQSTNLFIPADVHKKDLEALHVLAWEMGLKSLYYLRSKSIAQAPTMGHAPGDMPEPTFASGPLYDAEPECLACQ